MILHDCFLETENQKYHNYVPVLTVKKQFPERLKM